MNMPTEFLADHTRAGLYATSADQLEAVRQAAAANGFEAWQLDMAQIRDAAALLRRTGQALKFPQWYGENWDALADCLTDLSWSNAEGFVLLLRDSAGLHAAQPALWQTFTELLGEVSEFWRDNDIAFWVIADAPATGLPVLPLKS